MPEGPVGRFSGQAVPLPGRLHVIVEILVWPFPPREEHVLILHVRGDGLLDPQPPLDPLEFFAVKEDITSPKSLLGLVLDDLY